AARGFARAPRRARSGHASSGTGARRSRLPVRRSNERGDVVGRRADRRRRAELQAAARPMTDRPVVRASDAEREQTVVSLRESCAAGRLTLEEFMARVDEAYAARTLDELEGVLRELPRKAPTPPARRRRRRLTLAAFGRVIRRGRWRVGK